MEWEDLDWINLAQDMDKWWALVNMVMNMFQSVIPVFMWNKSRNLSR
jgi:hypothetical protein